jgi:hypothetical protein
MPAEEILHKRGELAAIGLGVFLGDGDEEAGKIEVHGLFERFSAFGPGLGSGFGNGFCFWFEFGHARNMRMVSEGIKINVRNLCVLDCIAGHQGNGWNGC